LSWTQIPEGAGVVYFNPEYGERMGDVVELEANVRMDRRLYEKEMPGV